MSHDRRRIVHVNVTASPPPRWTVQQVVEAFPYEAAPRFLLHDPDRIFAHSFTQRVESMGINEVVTAPRSPWQNPHCERLIGSIRRECLDHVIVLGERHLKRVLRSYASYYHTSRTHRSLNSDWPFMHEHSVLEPSVRHPPARMEFSPPTGGTRRRSARCRSLMSGWWGFWAQRRGVRSKPSASSRRAGAAAILAMKARASAVASSGVFAGSPRSSANRPNGSSQKHPGLEAGRRSAPRPSRSKISSRSRDHQLPSGNHVLERRFGDSSAPRQGPTPLPALAK